jgi:hypothetical protein
MPDLFSICGLLRRSAGQDRPFGAHIQTFSALLYPDAFHGHPTQLSEKLLGFRTMTPWASQGTSFQENGCAYAGPVLHGKSLDVINLPN